MNARLPGNDGNTLVVKNKSFPQDQQDKVREVSADLEKTKRFVCKVAEKTTVQCIT